MKRKQKIYIFIKDIIDLILSTIALILLSPVFLIIAILIKIESKGPIFFKQKRVGKDKKNFYIHKFRTMYIDTPKDVPTHLLKNSNNYITNIGKILRKTSLDELPQLIDVIFGNMSLIGPRPALYNQYDLIKERDKYNANAVKPGITGLAQINGRDELEIAVKAKYDGEYVKNINFILDIKIFFKTIIKIFKQENIVEGYVNNQNKKNKILVISQYYYPEPLRVSDVCEELVKKGNVVDVVTGIPNYPEGKIYPKYKKNNNKDEMINGVKIHHCFTIPRKKGIIYRILNYYSFMISSTNYIKKIKDEYDVVFVYQLSPVLMANAAIKYKKKYNKKVILYCLDIWPESLKAGNIKTTSLIYKYFHYVSKKIYTNVDKILVSSNSFIKYLKNEFEINEKNMVYIPQYSEDIYNSKECNKKENEQIDLMFAGNIGKAQSIETIIKAANELKEDNSIKFHILGSGSELDNIKKLAIEKYNLKNIEFYGRKPLKDMPKYYSKADAMLVTFKEDDFLSMTLPGKVQGYMLAGKPIISAASGETNKIICEAKCGYCSESEDYKGLVENIIKLKKLDKKKKNELGINAKKYYENNFNKDKIINKIIKELK